MEKAPDEGFAREDQFPGGTAVETIMLELHTICNVN
jgi:hypothetical protein